MLRRWHNLFEQRQPLRGQFLGETIDTGNVAAGSGQRLGHTVLDRVIVKTSNDRHGLCDACGCRDRRLTGRQDEADVKADKFRRETRQPRLVVVAVALDQHVVAPLALAERGHALAKRFELIRAMVRTLDLEPADLGGRSGARSSVCSEGPRDCVDHPDENVPAPHTRTSGSGWLILAKARSGFQRAAESTIFRTPSETAQRTTNTSLPRKWRSWLTLFAAAASLSL